MSCCFSRTIVAILGAVPLCLLPLVTMSACASTASIPTSATTNDKVHNPMQSDTHSIATEIDSLCDWLTIQPRPARTTAKRLGTIESEGGSAIHVQPTSDTFARAIVSRELDSSQTSYVELALASSGAVTVARLQARYGEYTEPPRVHFDSPATIHFFVDRDTDRPLTCLLVATIEEGEAGISDGAVIELAVRVDPR